MKEKVKPRLKAPFPWFGVKYRIADAVWERFGDVQYYVEPFAGSLAILLNRPARHLHSNCLEIINDKDAFVENFWRSLQADPDGLCKWSEWPPNEAALHSRHTWLLRRGKSITSKVMTDPHYYNLKMAGWWVWGISMWIAAGWCHSTRGKPKLPSIAGGRGVHRIGLATTAGLKQYFQVLSKRLHSVHVCCGDWKRVLGPTIVSLGPTAVFLDPPYGDERQPKLYSVDDTKLYLEVRDWAVKNGSNPKLRIALCGYDSELSMPNDWTCLKWKAQGGYASQAAGRTKAKGNVWKEIVWFSPHCLTPRLGLLGRVLDERRIGR